MKPKSQFQQFQHFEVSQRFFFDAAHTLKRNIEKEGSARVHGHTYHAEIALVGAPQANTGMVVDLGLLRAAIERLRPKLDHQLLDEVHGMGPPTLENLCLFIHGQLADTQLPVSRVSVWREGLGDRCDFKTA
jgi:6-pyruvoyltetrahydropterin/6-carboxytetrahydropterin synthase